MIVYIVEFSSGQYSDYCTNVEGVFSTVEKARAFVNREIDTYHDHMDDYARQRNKYYGEWSADGLSRCVNKDYDIPTYSIYEMEVDKP